MRVLIITSERRWTSAIQAVLPKGHTLSTWRPDEMEQNAAIMQAMDVCFVVGESLGPATVDIIRRVGANREIAIFAVADRVEADDEEMAILAGARQVFKYPLRSKLVVAALQYLPRQGKGPSAAPFALCPIQPAARAIENSEILAVLRDFSRLLPHAVNGPNFLGEYLRRLREVLRSSRLILYLTDVHSAEKRLKCVFTSGVDARAFEAIQLTQSAGIPSMLIQRGSLVQRSRLREHLPAENSALRELDVFGTELAVPLSARDGFVGVLLVGSRIAGSDYSEGELTLLFHLMEELGAAVRNAELHAELLRERTTFSSVLQALPIGFLVLRSDHRILHANECMRRMLEIQPHLDPKWEDLPASWASAAYDVLHRRMESHETIVDHLVLKKPAKLRITINPLEPVLGDRGRSVAITVVDITTEVAAEKEHAQAMAHPMLPRVGASLANELRNLFTPFYVITQFASQGTPPEAMMRILSQLDGASERIQRRIDDLAYLAPEALVPTDTTPQMLVKRTKERLTDLITTEEAARVTWSENIPEDVILADETAVSLAVTELVLNALEASSAVVEVVIHLDRENLSFRIKNTGSWPLLNSDRHTYQPFMSTKNRVGIGLEVATRVAQSHGGDLVLTPFPNNTVEAALLIRRHPLFPEAR